MKKYVLGGLAVALVILVVTYTLLTPKLNGEKYDKISPRKGEIVEAVYGLGRVRARQSYEIKLGVVSTIQKVFATEGQFVEKGQKLLSLDSGNIFRAPFTGTVTSLPVHDGETVGAQIPLLKLENLDDLYIEISLEQEAAIRIRKTQHARISFESIRGQFLDGQVASLFPRDDEFIATITVEKFDKAILPGMSADVAIEVGKVTGTTIPLKAVRNGFVNIERDGKIKKLKVEVGLIDGISAEIKNGDIKLEDLVLVPKE